MLAIRVLLNWKFCNRS